MLQFSRAFTRPNKEGAGIPEDQQRSRSECEGINNELIMVGDACKNEYIAIQNRIRRSRWVHIDETGFHVEGKKYWLWAFRSAENDVLITVVDSSGRDVVRETMGDNFHGFVIVDGWRAYSYPTITQRCWAQLIREVDAFMNIDHGKELSDEIHSMFRELKETLKSENMDQRKAMKIAFDMRMEDLLKRYDQYMDLHKPIEYIKTVSDHGSHVCSIQEWNRQTILLNRP